MESFLGLDLSRNYSFFTVPAAFFVIAIPHVYGVRISGGTYDNANPRGHNEAIKKQLILRAKAATENGFETFGLYAAGVAAANHARVSVPALNALTLSYVACRTAYNVAYVWLQADRRLCWIRSVVWTVSIGLIMTLWVKAGNKMLEVPFISSTISPPTVSTGIPSVHHLQIDTLQMLPFNCIVFLFASTAFALPGERPAITTEPTTTASPTIKCDYKYCDEKGTSWCFHFVPFTTIDPTLGPLPGETRTSIGLCGAKTAEAAPAH
ncbi:hypothetical protein FALBO_9312 [Fusarium albosuccineum]|uniref:Uncharacterized protein n=1 Tax=Fusarium albosuccineum TaxID=1237068 RepID=A0A8H4P940_9HYPO|nr:hypothetical protein FALBO_9312 [Fusarium albosuccineum]